MKKEHKMTVESMLGGAVVVAVAIALVVYMLFFYEKKDKADSPVSVSVSEQMKMTGELETKTSINPEESGNDAENSVKSGERSEEPEEKSEEPEKKSEEPEKKSEEPKEKSEKPKEDNQQEKPGSTEKTTSLDEIMQAQQNVDGQSQADVQTSVNASSYASQVLELLNAQRRSAGLIELTYDSGIAVAAQKRAGELISDFSHVRPDGRNCFTALDEQGCVYQGAGENIAMGQKTPQDVMNSWMQSEGHKANILNASYTRVGIGCYQDKMGQMYWVQLFTY